MTFLLTPPSPNFSWRELTRSQAADRLGLQNTPTPAHAANLKALCTHILEPVRAHFGPTHVSSAYRAPTVNTAVGGSATSQHMTGEAADIECHPTPNLTVAHWIAANLPFDQLILEFYSPTDPFAGWVHVSFTSGPPRKSILTAQKSFASKTTYVKGLPSK